MLRRTTRVSPKDLALFTRQLSTMLRSGLPLVNALATLKAHCSSPALASAIDCAETAILDGDSLHAGFALAPKIFSPLYIALIAAGERAGILESTLDTLAKSLEDSAALRAKMRRAAAYPTLVLLTLGATVAFLLTAVIPTFEELFSESGVQLPWLTCVVLNISRGVSYYWGYGLITSVVFIINSTLLVKHVPYAKRLVEQAKLTIPLIRDLLRKRYSAESATLLASLLGAGIPIIQALEIVTATVQNSVIAEQLSFMRSALYDGASLSGALESATFFPPLVKQMVGVGEVSGRLEEMLAKVGAHFAEEVESFLKTLHDLVEPALVLMIGLVVGTLVLAIYLPLFQIGEVASLG